MWEVIRFFFCTRWTDFTPSSTQLRESSARWQLNTPLKWLDKTVIWIRSVFWYQNIHSFFFYCIYSDIPVVVISLHHHWWEWKKKPRLLPPANANIIYNIVFVLFKENMFWMKEIYIQFNKCLTIILNVENKFCSEFCIHSGMHHFCAFCDLSK